MKSLRTALVGVRNKVTGASPERQKRIEDLLLSIQSEAYKITNISKGVADYSSVGIMPVDEKTIAVKIFNDLIMYMDPRDLAVVPHIALERIWEKDTTTAWLHVLDTKKPRTILDVGANFGYFGLLAAQRVKHAKGRVVLFEANIELMDYLNKSFSVNWLNEGVSLENLAITDKRETVTLKLLENYIGSSSLHTSEKLNEYLGHKMNVKVEKELKVAAISLDEYCADSSMGVVDLIKMDIEGFEEAAYNGMTEVIKKSPDLVMFIEFTPSGYADPKDLFKKMHKDFNFCYGIEEDGTLEDISNQPYNSVIADPDDLRMLVMSKKSLK